jgi:ribosomal protein S8
MKEKLLAIIRADTDEDTKADLIADLAKQIEDKEMMNTANEFLIFSTKRNDFIVDELGILGFIDDCKSVTKEQIWGWFKDYLIEKTNNQYGTH